MTVRISKPEMELLGYLHEHAQRYDVKGQFNCKALVSPLQMTEEPLQRNISFLKGHNLVGSLDTANSKFKGAIAVWLTPEGENLMRKIEEDLNEQLLRAPDYQPSRGVKITLKAAGYLMDTAKEIVVAVVAKAITG